MNDSRPGDPPPQEPVEHASPYRASTTPLADPPAERVGAGLRPKTKCLLFMLAWAIPFGITIPVVPRLAPEHPGVHTMVHMICWLILFIAGSQWMAYDAADRRFKLWKYFKLLMVICPGPLIMVPLYFLKTRSFLLAARDSLISAAFVFSVLFVTVVSGAATTFVLLMLGFDEIGM